LVRFEFQKLIEDVVPRSDYDGDRLFELWGKFLIENPRLNLIRNQQKQYIGDFRSLSKIVLYDEALGYGVGSVGVFSIRNEDFLIRNATVAEILSLCCALVSETW